MMLLYQSVRLEGRIERRELQVVVGVHPVGVGTDDGGMPAGHGQVQGS